MKLHQERHRLDISKSDLSGSLFDDVNLSGGTRVDHLEMRLGRVEQRVGRIEDRLGLVTLPN